MTQSPCWMEAVEARTLLSGSTAASGMTFNVTYDQSLGDLSTAQRNKVKASIAYVTHELATTFTNRVTINLRVAYDPSEDLAGSDSRLEQGAYNYSQVRAALLAKTPGDAADLPKADPTKGGAFTTTSALAKVLGLPLDAPAKRSDGTVYFGKGAWTFAPLEKRKVRGKYDFAGSMEHEITEVMGRVSYLDASKDDGYGYSPIDLFRYRSAGMRSLDGSTSDSNDNGDQAPPIAYFSLDAGKTKLRDFAATTDEDVQDWNGYNHDAFDAEGGTSDATPITSVGLQVMTALGFTTRKR